MGSDLLFASPPSVAPDPSACEFYHTMDLPGIGVVDGQWDLRPVVDAYLGGVDFRGKRVLEIGPASGFLTLEMEKRGASVVAIEVTDERGWDFVPYHNLSELTVGRAEHMSRIKNSFWYVHHAFSLNAKMHYGDIYKLPDELGDFDIAVMSAVLLHTQSPHMVIAECAKRARTLIISDLLYRDLENLSAPLLYLVPNFANRTSDTWWAITTSFLDHYTNVLGFTKKELTFHQPMSRWGPKDCFTLVASADN